MDTFKIEKIGTFGREELSYTRQEIMASIYSEMAKDAEISPSECSGQNLQGVNVYVHAPKKKHSTAKIYK